MAGTVPRFIALRLHHSGDNEEFAIPPDTRRPRRVMWSMGGAVREVPTRTSCQLINIGKCMNIGVFHHHAEGLDFGYTLQRAAR